MTVEKSQKKASRPTLGSVIGPMASGPQSAVEVCSVPMIRQVPVHCPGNQPIDGRAYGVELLVRTPMSRRLSGWLSYTLSRSTREAHFLTPAGGDAVASVPSEGDHTHVLNAILAYDLGHRWRAGGRFFFFTGGPYSRMEGEFALPPYNSMRYRPFFRVDVRVEKRWSVGKTGSLAFVLEGQNVTLSKEW